MDFSWVWQDALAGLRALLTWMEGRPGLASWLQAIGSILALAIAIWLASSQSRQAKAERRAAKREQFDAVIGLAEEAVYLMQATANAMVEWGNGEYFDSEYSPRTFEEVSTALLDAALKTPGTSEARRAMQSLRRLMINSQMLTEVAKAEYRSHKFVMEGTAATAKGCATDGEQFLRTLRRERMKLR